jgi:hypothetical protein
VPHDSLRATVLSLARRSSFVPFQIFLSSFTGFIFFVILRANLCFPCAKFTLGNLSGIVSTWDGREAVAAPHHALSI